MLIRAGIRDKISQLVTAKPQTEDGTTTTTDTPVSQHLRHRAKFALDEFKSAVRTSDYNNSFLMMMASSRSSSGVGLRGNRGFGGGGGGEEVVMFEVDDDDEEEV